jgi:predicted type IV restriction endonuclease
MCLDKNECESTDVSEKENATINFDPHEIDDGEELENDDSNQSFDAIMISKIEAIIESLEKDKNIQSLSNMNAPSLDSFDIRTGEKGNQVDV